MQAAEIFVFSTRNLTAREKIYKKTALRSTSLNATDYTIKRRFIENSRKKQKNQYFTEY